MKNFAVNAWILLTLWADMTTAEAVLTEGIISKGRSVTDNTIHIAHLQAAVPAQV